MKNGIVVIGATFVDIKGYPSGQYVPNGRNAGNVIEVHGGVSRNIAEDIANIELRPTFLSIVDESALGQEVIDKLNRHKVNTSYIRKVKDGLGTWLAIFSNEGDEIFAEADSICVEFDIEALILKKFLSWRINTIRRSTVRFPICRLR